MQKLINNGAGAGYYRALDAHQAFAVPLSLHITPTFASAIQWATSASLGADDGPAFNTRIGSLARERNDRFVRQHFLRSSPALFQHRL